MEGYGAGMSGGANGAGDMGYYRGGSGMGGGQGGAGMGGNQGWEFSGMGGSYGIGEGYGSSFGNGGSMGSRTGYGAGGDSKIYDVKWDWSMESQQHSHMGDGDTITMDKECNTTELSNNDVRIGLMLTNGVTWTKILYRCD